MSLDERIDPVDLLSMYSAPSEWNSTVELTGPDADARALSLLERIVGGVITATGPRRRHLRLVTGVIVAASLGGAAVAAAAILARSPQDPQAIVCWSEPVTPPDAQVALDWDGVVDPVVMCAGEWERGILGSDGPPDALQACVTAEGVAAVVPGDSATCERLGLSAFAPLDPTTDEGLAMLNVGELERMLVETYNFGPCQGPDIVSPKVRLVLDDLGFEDWDVTTAGFFTADEPCASVSVEPATRSVLVVPG